MAIKFSMQLRKHQHFLMAMPALVWMVMFFLLPVLIVGGLSFMSRGIGGIPELPLTLEHYQRIFSVFNGIFARSVWIAILSTIICLLAAYPLAFYISTRHRSITRNTILFLVILPFWTNFLVRIYAWRILLGREGPLNGFLMHIGVLQEPIQLLNTEFAVVLGLVYGYLPFMVLPIYASVERLDWRLVEVARDLGAKDWSVFWRVIFPLTLPGIIAGCILVFVPTIGAYVTPDMLGGTEGIMIGNLIQRQYSGTGNLPLGAALSMMMMAVVLIALMVYARWGHEEG